MTKADLERLNAAVARKGPKPSEGPQPSRLTWGTRPGRESYRLDISKNWAKAKVSPPTSDEIRRMQMKALSLDLDFDLASDIASLSHPHAVSRARLDYLWDQINRIEEKANREVQEILDILDEMGI